MMEQNESPSAGEQEGQIKRKLSKANNDQHKGDVNVPYVLNLDRKTISTLTGDDRDKAEMQLVEKAAALEDDPLKQEKVVNYACESLGVRRRIFQKAVKKFNERKQHHALIPEKQENRSSAKLDLSERTAIWTRAAFMPINRW